MMFFFLPLLLIHRLLRFTALCQNAQYHDMYVSVCLCPVHRAVCGSIPFPRNNKIQKRNQKLWHLCHCFSSHYLWTFMFVQQKTEWKKKYSQKVNIGCCSCSKLGFSWRIVFFFSIYFINFRSFICGQILIFVLCICAERAIAKPQGAVTEEVTILRQESNREPDGSYQYG